MFEPGLNHSPLTYKKYGVGCGGDTEVIVVIYLVVI